MILGYQVNWTDTRKYITYTNNDFRDYGKRVPKYETEITRYRGRSNLEIQKNKMENKVDSILSGIIAISNMVSNPQVNNRPKKKIRRYRTLSKQAMKEYAMYSNK